MRKIFIILSAITITFSCLFVLLCCFGFYYDDDDFASYKNETKDVCIELDGDPYIISDIESQLIRIAAEYLKEPSLSYVEYKYRNENDIKAMFFCEEKYMGGKYNSNLSIYVDAVSHQIYSINYEYGITKRISGFPTAHLQKNIDIKEKLADISKESEFLKHENAYIKLWFQLDDIVAFVINDEGHILWRSN